ncbi:MAG: hypothetical protein GF403_04800, partial [Candidatus Coatesbacteria bacterium]|nr:hypothetical protein [Candidatus Coatesbacteria bacterium]
MTIGPLIDKLRRLEGWGDLRSKALHHWRIFRRRFLNPRGRFHYLQYRRRVRAWRAKRPLDYPNVVHLELSSRCNANCKMCPHHRLSRPRRDMPTETARRVIL